MLCASVSTATEDLNPWAQFLAPIAAAPQVHGTYGSGCLVGAEFLDVNGVGFETVNRHRKRFYAHPELKELLLDWSSEMLHREHNKRWIIADIGQAVGGPTTTGHSSHQVGLDVDIRLRLLSKDDGPFDNENNIDTPYMVQYSKTVDGKKTLYKVEFRKDKWHAEMTPILEKVAQNENVQRLFLNAPIKKFLCEQFVIVDASVTPGNGVEMDLQKFMASDKKIKSPFSFPKWLEKVRPESGHAAHVHVRLHCPHGDETCIAQDPPPVDSSDASGVGCSGKTFNAWFGQGRLKAEFHNPETGGIPVGSSSTSSLSHWQKVMDGKAFPKVCKDLIKDNQVLRVAE